MLNEIDGVDCVEPEGAFYAFPSVKGLLGREPPGQRPATSAELAEVCIDEAKVAVVPGEAFGAPGYFRMSYALGDDDLVEGVSRLARLFARGARLSADSSSGGSEETTTVARVLVTEKLAQSGLDLLADAGHEVDVQRGPRPRGSCSRRSSGAHALIIRSATQVTAEVLAAGTDLRGGRAGRHRPRQRRRRPRPPTAA